MALKNLGMGAVLALVAATASASVVTFEQPITTTASGFTTQGYDFDVQTNHYHLEGGSRFGTDSATTSLIIDDYLGDNSLTLKSIGGGFFNLNAFDIVSASADFGSTTVQILGALAGGGSVSLTYTDPDLNTFETVLLGWTNLASVTFNGIGNSGAGLNFFRLDNVDVGAAVPEPVSAALLGLGLAGIGLSRKRSATRAV